MPARNGNRFQQFVHGFVSFKLRESGIRLEGFNDDTAAPTLAALNLRRVTNELVMKNEALFSSMCDRLNLTDATTYATFVGIADEMFQTGYNWGRIVALFAFGGTISVYCARRTDLVANVDNLVQWLSTYMEQRLGSWFDSNGGWVSKKPGNLSSSLLSRTT